MAKAKTKSKAVSKKKPATKKAASKKKVAKTKKVTKAKSARKANASFMKPMNVSSELSAVVGRGPMPRSDVVKKLWGYIRKNGLQDQKNKRNINADASLQKVFDGKKTVSMFEMTKLVSKHLS